MYIYILYIDRERKRERKREIRLKTTFFCVSMVTISLKKHHILY